MAESREVGLPEPGGVIDGCIWLRIPCCGDAGCFEQLRIDSEALQQQREFRVAAHCGKALGKDAVVGEG